jgi:mitochondrial genome maintenance exonuclease 1
VESELWRSVGGALEKFQTPANLVETHLTHPTLLYKGIVDCITVVEYEALFEGLESFFSHNFYFFSNTIRIIEWKKSDRLKANIEHTYDAPIQLAAYLGALQSSEKHQQLDIRNGVVVVAYTTGVPAHVHLLNESDLNKYWRKWLARLQEYWVRLRDNTLPENL